MFRIKQYAVFFCAAFLIGGCSLKPNVTLTDSGQVLPDYRPLLQLDQPGNTWEDRNQAQIPPVQIYMDNTGSMEGFIFDEIMNDNHADPKFVHMMRAFREMENTFFKTSCYTIHQNEQGSFAEETPPLLCRSAMGYSPRIWYPPPMVLWEEHS